MLRRLALVALAAPAAALAITGVIAPLHRAVEQLSAIPGAEDAYLRGVEAARAELTDEVILAERPVDLDGGGAVELYYYLAQYALAPVLVEPRPARPRLLVVEPREDRLEARLARPGTRLLKKLGPGLALVETRPVTP